MPTKNTKIARPINVRIDILVPVFPGIVWTTMLVWRAKKQDTWPMSAATSFKNKGNSSSRTNLHEIKTKISIRFASGRITLQNCIFDRKRQETWIVSRIPVGRGERGWSNGPRTTRNCLLLFKHCVEAGKSIFLFQLFLLLNGGQCKTKTAECRQEGQMQTEGEMETADQGGVHIL